MITYFQHIYRNPNNTTRTGEEYRADKMFQNISFATVQKKMKTIKWPDDIYAVHVRQAQEPKDIGKHAGMVGMVYRVNLTKQEWD